jgi:CIC family chloride channel protein
MPQLSKSGIDQFLSRVRTIRRNSSEEGMETGRNLLKWLGLGLVIGVVAGLGAIAFTWAIDFCTRLFLGNLAGYTPPSALGEGTAVITPAQRPWVLPLVLAFGGLLSGLIVYRFAPEAAGHGTDAAIAAFHQRGGKVRARVPLIKLITSAITIGSGGSGGREGPTAQISSGFGSLLATWLGLDVRERRIAMVAGMGAGIGAIFRAPLGGAVMAAEILYLHDLEVEVLIPGLVASIVGYSVYASVYGWTPIFGAELGNLTFNNPVQLLYYAALGAICGLIGLLYARSFISTDRFFHHLRLGNWRVPNWLKPALGGFLVGLMGIVSPGFIHMGYGWVQATLSPSAITGLLSLPLWLVILLPFGKIVATSLSIGSGGSGGIFGPGMVIGGFVGAAFWRITEGWLPGVPTNPAPFVIIAMMALFGGVAHAPLAVMLMVAEMTGNLSMLAPAMVAVAISLLICGNRTIYVNQMGSRADSPAHRYRFSFPLLASLPLVEVLQKPFTVLHPDQSIEETRNLLKKSKWSGLPVVDERGCLIGVLTNADLERQRLLAEPNKPQPIEKVLNRQPVIVEANESLVRVLELMAEHQVSWLPVVEDENNRKLSGVVGVAEVVKAYQAGLNQEVKSLGASLNNMSIIEVQIDPQSRVNGLMLKELQLPEDTLVISIHRRGELVIPRGTTRLQSGDVIRVITEPGRRRVLQRYLSTRRTDQIKRGPVDPVGQS